MASALVRTMRAGAEASARPEEPTEMPADHVKHVEVLFRFDFRGSMPGDEKTLTRFGSTSMICRNVWPHMCALWRGVFLARDTQGQHQESRCPSA